MSWFIIIILNPTYDLTRNFVHTSIGIRISLQDKFKLLTWHMFKIQLLEAVVVVPLTATAAQKCIESVTVIIEPEIKSLLS